MMAFDQAQRSRGPPNGPATDTGSRPTQDLRNGGGAPVTMSRAERFEDEKRRIIESCFGRKDADGSSTLPLSRSRTTALGYYVLVNTWSQI